MAVARWTCHFAGRALFPAKQAGGLEAVLGPDARSRLDERRYGQHAGGEHSRQEDRSGRALVERSRLADVVSHVCQWLRFRSRRPDEDRPRSLSAGDGYIGPREKEMDITLEPQESNGCQDGQRGANFLRAGVAGKEVARDRGCRQARRFSKLLLRNRRFAAALEALAGVARPNRHFDLSRYGCG